MNFPQNSRVTFQKNIVNHIQNNGTEFSNDFTTFRQGRNNQETNRHPQDMQYYVNQKPRNDRYYLRTRGYQGRYQQSDKFRRILINAAESTQNSPQQGNNQFRGQIPPNRGGGQYARGRQRQKMYFKHPRTNFMELAQNAGKSSTLHSPSKVYAAFT